MNKLNSVVDRVIEYAKKEVKGEEETCMQKNVISDIVKWHTEDMFKLIINIEQTSLNEEDKTMRYLKLGNEFGIDTRYLLKK